MTALVPLARAVSLQAAVASAEPMPLPDPPERHRLRDDAYYTQAEAAFAIGVSVRTIGYWESGKATPTGARRRLYGSLLRVFSQVGR